MSKDTSNYAFPVNEAEHGVNYSHGGMSLRDYFAGNAMNGICASGPGVHMHDHAIAAEAYRLADAMLAERAK